MVALKMFRRISRNKELMLGGLFSAFEIKPVSFEEYKKARGLYLENDWERVKVIFSKDDYGCLHPELVRALDMTQFGFFVGAFIGGWRSSKRQTEEFFRNNDVSLFFNAKEAHRKLANENILGFFKGAARWGPRFAIFFGGYSLISSCFEAYRNKSGIIENTIGGGGIGAIIKMNYGIKGMISGGVVGAVMGTIYGIILCTISKLAKKDIIEIKYAQFALSKYREEAFAKKKNERSEDTSIVDENLHIKHVPNPLDSFEEP